MTQKTRPPKTRPPGEDLAQRAARMIRVDHAGETGAARIYAGQLAVLRARPGTAHSVDLIEKMAAQEVAHLRAFDRLIAARRVRPTALLPVWNVAGFALGAVTALMGEKAAMACTAAVEQVIDEHYAAQTAELAQSDPELSDLIEEFRQDEVHHRETALAEGAEQTPGYGLLSAVIRAGCRTAIKVAERI